MSITGTSPLSQLLLHIEQATAAARAQAATAPMPTAPDLSDADVQAAAEAARRAAAASQGRTSTILTSGLGATDPLKTSKKTLLGA